MALQAFKRLLTGDFTLNQIQANVEAIFNQLRNTPFLTGQLFDQTPSTTGGHATSGVVITTGGTKFYHNLGYTPTGWLITNRNANAVVWQAPATPEVSNPTTQYIILQASATVTADLWVF